MDEELITEGGNGGVGLENRMEDAENRIAAMADELLRVNTQTVHINAKIELLEARQSKQEDDVRQIKEAAHKMEITFNEVMRRWDKTDERIYEMYKSSQTDNKADKKILYDLFKFVLTGTIIAIVAFLFKGGV